MRHGSAHAATLGTALLLLTASPLPARPVHRQAFADHYGTFLAKRLNDCRTCHLPEKPGEARDDLATEKPHNPFGARLKAVRPELRRAGKQATIPERLAAVAAEDSDGDGVPNQVEILSGHNPGEAADRPTDAEVARVPEVLAAFRQAQTGYRWRPFETVRRPPVPAVKNAGWVRNPVDAFIAAEHERHGLAPRPEAPRQILLRRVYFDLMGLPPTPEELHAFLQDPSSDAYEKVVDRLLASPQYGERWGRHWMDVWRYSDWAGWTDGGQIRDSQPHIWRWRDWIVEALNADKGYDRMVLEMLAADELAPEDADALRATGYLVRNYKMLSRETWLQDTVNHTAQAFLGVTLACARCHDHMYDPILQKEYYQVRAVFEPHQVRLDRVPGELDTKKDGLARAYDANLDAETYLFVRGDDRTPDKSKPLPPGVPDVLGGTFPKVEPVKLPRLAYAPDRRLSVLADLRHAGAKEIAKAKPPLAAAQRRAAVLAAPLPAPPLGALAGLSLAAMQQAELELADLDLRLAHAKQEALEMMLRAEELEDAGRRRTPEWESAARVAFTTQRIVAALQAKRELLALLQAALPRDGNARAALEQKRSAAKQAFEKASAALLEFPRADYPPRVAATYPPTSTGRRLAFSRWVAGRDNPLTARVAMNHVWLRHFGQAIVPSVFDFGRNGRPPSHPALLDWLSAEFMDRKWSMKEMHRLLVTSSTYRQASTPDEVNLVRDRDNKYLWRMNARRLEAELVRDGVFYVAGRLDLTRGGPDIDQERGLTVPRRSLYFRHAAEKQMTFLKIFDAAGVTECYQRKESVLPQQALALNNSELTLRHSQLLARDLTAKFGPDAAAFVTAAFERVLSRPPTVAELAECAAFLETQAKRYNGGSPGQRARAALVKVLLNHNDFVTVR